MSQARIVCRGVAKELASGDHTLRILTDIELEIPGGEFVAILGPSGSGKSTLLGLIAGLDRPTGGTVELDGRDLGGLDEDELALLRRERIGFVFQSFQLLSNLTAEENVRVPLELCGVGGAGERAARWIAAVGLTERSHHYPSQLSGGEMQRVALARAFASGPAVLLADEPTGNLDRETGKRVLDLLVDLREREGTTLVLVTHDVDVARRADRRIYLEGGRIERVETARPTREESHS